MTRRSSLGECCTLRARALVVMAVPPPGHAQLCVQHLSDVCGGLGEHWAQAVVVLACRCFLVLVVAIGIQGNLSQACKGQL